MPETDRQARSRTAAAFRALDTGGDLAKRRAWHRVERRSSEERARGRRRLGWVAGIAAGAVAVFALAGPPALAAARAWSEPSQHEQQRVAITAVMEMLGQQQARSAESGDAAGVDDLAEYLVTEAHPGAQ